MIEDIQNKVKQWIAEDDAAFAALRSKTKTSDLSPSENTRFDPFFEALKPHEETVFSNRPISSYHPFKVTVHDDESGGRFVTVQDGVIGSITPTIAGTPLYAYPPPTLSISSSGSVHIYFRMEYTVELNSFGSFVAYATIESVDILAGGVLPSNNETYLYERLAVVNDGGVTQVHETSLAWRLCDDGSGAGEVLLTLGRA